MKILQFSILLGLALFNAANALSCIPCEELVFDPDTGTSYMKKRECPKLNCPGSEVPGLCDCCNRCAKQLGETCGGDFNMEGQCDTGLRCEVPEGRKVHKQNGEINIEFMPSRGGKCVDTKNPADCMDICAMTHPGNNYPVGMSTLGRPGYFDYKAGNFTEQKWIYCDCSGGPRNEGWMIMQRQYLNMESFDKQMIHYEQGFGMSTGDYWMGLNAIRYFTSLMEHELRITLEVKNGRKIVTYFDKFSIGDAEENYKLHLHATPHSMSRHFAAMHDEMEFTARDSDNDKWVNGNCAKSYRGGWWFNRCTDYNLNGRLYGVSPFPAPEEFTKEDGPDRVSWGSACSGFKVVKTEMAIRPKPSPTPVYY